MELRKFTTDEKGERRDLSSVRPSPFRDGASFSAEVCTLRVSELDWLLSGRLRYLYCRAHAACGALLLSMLLQRPPLPPQL